MFAQKEHADYERRRANKAFYSLDACDGIERDIIFVVSSPQEIYERKFSNQELYTAISNLPEKQAKRVYAHFFLHMSKAGIAKVEDVSERAVRESIERGLKNIAKFLEKFFITPFDFIQKICWLIEGQLLPPPSKGTLTIE